MRRRFRMAIRPPWELSTHQGGARNFSLRIRGPSAASVRCLGLSTTSLGVSLEWAVAPSIARNLVVLLAPLCIRQRHMGQVELQDRNSEDPLVLCTALSPALHSHVRELAAPEEVLTYCAIPLSYASAFYSRVG